VQVADMNGDGRYDLVLNPVMFPHTIPHSLIKPILLMNGGSGTLSPSDWLASAPEAAHHMSYRFGLPDLNRDGTPDYVSSSMGLITRNSDGSYTNRWEAVPVHLSNGSGGWVDATRNVQGQENLQADGFGHDFAWGDVNGDGWTDFYTGGHLYLNDKGVRFTIGDDILPRLAAAPMWENAGAGFAMSSLIADLNRDGFGDLLLWYADSWLGTPDVAGYIAYGGPKSVGERGILPLPDGLYGDRNTKFNYAVAGDLNHDGYDDVLIGETRIVPYYHGRQIQILMNHDGTLVDESASRLPIEPRAYLTEPAFGTVGNGEGQIFLVDVNDDGHIDIVDGGGINYDNREDQFAVLLNDGTGHFSNMPLSAVPYVQPWQLAGEEWKRDYFQIGHFKTIPIDLDGKNGIDWISSVFTPPSSLYEPHEITLYTVLSTARYGKAGDGKEGWQVGAPGFDEAYYLNNNPDVAAAVARGGIASGLAHYLSSGRSEGRFAFAPNTKVWGSDQDDQIVLREGNETAKAGAGNDYVSGGAGDDLIDGGSGNDTMDGGDGSDTALFSGIQASYRFAFDGNALIMSGPDGIDTLTNIENLNFSTGGLVQVGSLLGAGLIEEIMSVQTGGVTMKIIPSIYSGPVSWIKYEMIGNAASDVIVGTSKNDFINLMGGDDAANGGGGDDVLDGGTGSNFLSGGAGRDDFFLDGRGGTTTWATITDWSAGERLSVWGWRPGVSKVQWVDSAGAPGWTGVTMHGDLDGNGVIDTSVTWTGTNRSQLPTALEFDGLLWFV
jgi:Ca2+-binding RTX toxin-like protein